MNKHVKEERDRRHMIEEMVDADMGGMTFDELWEMAAEYKMQDYEKMNSKQLKELYEERFSDEA